MPQPQSLGLVTSPPPDPVEHRRVTVTTVTAVVFIAGLMAVLGVALWSQSWPVPGYIIEVSTIWPYALFVAAGFISEIVFVPVRHGDVSEELTFFEILVMCGVLLFLPIVALVGPLVGFMLAEPLLRRSLTKTLFNIGSYALASSALVAIYGLVAGTAPRFSLPCIIGLLIGAIAFTVINLFTLAWVLYVADGVPVRQLVREQMSLSIGMAIACLGVAATAVALAINTPLLVPFALLPAAALWYAYRSSAHHNEAVERNRWMVELSTALSGHTGTGELVPKAANALRQVFAATYVEVIKGATTYSSPGSGGRPIARPSTQADLLLATSARPYVIAIPEVELPSYWHVGYSVRVELGGEPGALCVGVSRQRIMMQRLLPWAPGQWHLAEVDWPVMATLAASLGSAIRATEHLAALRDETAKMKAVVDHATDGIVVFDGHGTVTIWSPAMEQITGIPGRDAVSGTSTGVTSEILDRLRSLAPREPLTAFAGAAPTRDLSIIRADGEQRDLQIAAMAIDEADQTTSEALTVLTVRDMTHERRVERMKSDFIATVSHELRTPITPIKGYAQLLSNRWDRMAEAKRTDVLATIVDRADHLSRLVDDLLLASRVADIESARLDVDLADVDLMGMVQESARAFPDLATRLTVSGPTATVRCDRVRAIQCVANLIGNAGKYSAAESPIGVVTGTSEGGRWAVVDVVDRGRGIPADELDKVFERFYRVEDPMTMTTGGSGLGLFISRELARAMGGDITVESTLNEGSRFTLTLPISNGESQS